MTVPTTFDLNAVYNAREMAQILRVSPDKLREIVRQGELRPLRYATGKSLFSGAALAVFLHQQSGGAS